MLYVQQVQNLIIDLYLNHIRHFTYILSDNFIFLIITLLPYNEIACILYQHYIVKYASRAINLFVLSDIINGSASNLMMIAYTGVNTLPDEQWNVTS